MICNSSEDLLNLIKIEMIKNNIQQKEIAVSIGKDPRNVSQVFRNGNPQCQTIFDIVSAMNLQMDINFINKNE